MVCLEHVPRHAAISLCLLEAQVSELALHIDISADFLFFVFLPAFIQKVQLSLLL